MLVFNNLSGCKHHPRGIQAFGRDFVVCLLSMIMDSADCSGIYIYIYHIYPKMFEEFTVYMNLKPSTIKIAWPNLVHQQYPNYKFLLLFGRFQLFILFQLPASSAKNPAFPHGNLLGFRSHDGWEVIEGQGVKHQPVIL